nr:MAG TPA: hypothetical protein [Caudoviricetes sp.]
MKSRIFYCIIGKDAVSVYKVQYMRCGEQKEYGLCMTLKQFVFFLILIKYKTAPHIVPATARLLIGNLYTLYSTICF